MERGTFEEKIYRASSSAVEDFVTKQNFKNVNEILSTLIEEAKSLGLNEEVLKSKFLRYFSFLLWLNQQTGIILHQNYTPFKPTSLPFSRVIPDFVVREEDKIVVGDLKYTTKNKVDEDFFKRFGVYLTAYALAMENSTKKDVNEGFVIIANDEGFTIVEYTLDDSLRNELIVEMLKTLNLIFKQPISSWKEEARGELPQEILDFLVNPQGYLDKESLLTERGRLLAKCVLQG
jgi:cyclophilin family peptidyl-prolyl cis-trans isomerase